MKALIKRIVTWVERVVDRVMKLKPVRVWFHYLERRGPLLSSGLSYQALFAVFAAIWVAFAAAGVFITGNPTVHQAVLDLLARSIPGLFSTDSTAGAIDPTTLTSVSILGWTGAIAAVGLFFTALGWLGSARTAVRSMFKLPDASTNFILLILKDLGLAVAFGAALLLSAVLSVLSTLLIGSVLDWLGINERKTVAEVLIRVAGFLIVLGLDTVVLGTLYRVLSGIKIPLRMLAPGTIIGALALGVLKVLGTLLLGGAAHNPLLVTFAVFVGLLIWFNLICQIILLGAAWISVSATDANLDLRGGTKVGKAGKSAGKTGEPPSGVTGAL